MLGSAHTWYPIIKQTGSMVKSRSGWSFMKTTYVQRWVDDFIVVWQAVKSQAQEIQEHMMILSDWMSVSMSVTSSSLEVLAANQTSIHVDPGERNRAQLLEIKVENTSVDCVEIRALFYIHFHCWDVWFRIIFVFYFQLSFQSVSFT